MADTSKPLQKLIGELKALPLVKTKEQEMAETVKELVSVCRELKKSGRAPQEMLERIQKACGDEVAAMVKKRAFPRRRRRRSAASKTKPPAASAPAAGTTPSEE
jgi:hypothetical protein